MNCQHRICLCSLVMQGRNWFSIPFRESVRRGKVRHRPMILAAGLPLNWICANMLEAAAGVLASAKLKSHADLLEGPITLNLGDPLGSALDLPAFCLLALTFAFRSFHPRDGDCAEGAGRGRRARGQGWLSHASNHPSANPFPQVQQSLSKLSGQLIGPPPHWNSGDPSYLGQEAWVWLSD